MHLHPFIWLSILLACAAPPAAAAAAACPNGGDPLGPRSPSATLSWGDFDGDGLVDAARLGPDGLRLLRNRGDGGFVDVTVRAGAPQLGGVRVVLWSDVDGDGDLDLLAGGAGGATLLVGDGRGGFVDATRGSGLSAGSGAVHGAAWLDFDGDGRPDLQLATERGDVLLRNMGQGAFAPVDLGLPVDEPRRGVARTLGAPRGAEAASAGSATAGPAPGAPYAAAAASGICAASLFDAALGGCMTASAVPTLGALMPLSVDFNVDAAGNVGMGTTAPGVKLDVVGDVRASGQLISTAASGAPLAVASSDLVTNLNADRLDGLHASAFSQLGPSIEGAEITDGTITSADLAPGAVGSGSLAPGSVGASELASAAVTSTKLATGAVDTTKIADGTLLNSDVSSAAAIAGTKIVPDFGSQTLTTTGSLGLGTSTPQVRLHVSTGTDVGPSTGGYLQVGNEGGNNVALDDNEIMARSALSPATLALNADGGDVTIGASGGAGRLGIGTASPLYDVHVRGNGSLGTLLVTPNVSDSQSEVRLAENQTASLGMILRYNGGNNDLEVRGYGAGGESNVHFFVDRDSGVAGLPTATARLGIGTASPAGMLHVAGAGGDGSVVLPTGSISSNEIANEVGIAFESITTTFVSVPSTTPKVVVSRMINCPSSGYVLAIATFDPAVGDLFGSGFYSFSINESATTHNSNNRETIYAEHAGHNQLTTLQGIFGVSAGTTTINLLASKNSSGYPDVFAYNPRLSLIFVPSAYGTVDVD